MRYTLLFGILLIKGLLVSGQPSNTKSIQKSGNPVFQGWYADPEGIIFDKK